MKDFIIKHAPWLARWLGWIDEPMPPVVEEPEPTPEPEEPIPQPEPAPGTPYSELGTDVKSWNAVAKATFPAVMGGFASTLNQPFTITSLRFKVPSNTEVGATFKFMFSGNTGTIAVADAPGELRRNSSIFRTIDEDVNKVLTVDGEDVKPGDTLYLNFAAWQNGYSQQSGYLNFRVES